MGSLQSNKQSKSIKGLAGGLRATTFRDQWLASLVSASFLLGQSFLNNRPQSGRGEVRAQSKYRSMLKKYFGKVRSQSKYRSMLK
jgi:hypothetical protein